MKKSVYSVLLVMVMILVWSSCTDDLNQTPTIEDTDESVYAEASNYKSVLAKLYASFVLAGQEEGGGDPDITDSNTGYDYMRVYINMQEIPTDELAYTWVEGDNLYDLSYLSWDENDNWVSDMYYHIYYTIALCNEFLSHAEEEDIAGFTESEQEEIRTFRAEARFIRALAYYHALDLYGNVPFVDEDTSIGGDELPEQYTREELFQFIESELTGISPLLTGPSVTEYGRASQAAAWALLAKLYLNGEVYTGTSYDSDCITYCDSIINLNYFSLENEYSRLFNADNHLRTNEIIFSFSVDATYSVSWGSTTYLVCGSVSSSNSDQQAADYGVTSGWGSFRAKSALTDLFSEYTGTTDIRGKFFTTGQSRSVTDLTDASTGYLFEKWTNLTDGGEAASNTSSDGVSTDLPVFRLADVYLMYAEASLRGGSNGSTSNALDYVNSIRQRAYGSNAGDITSADLTLDFILEERARELYLESTRRTDLIRYDLLTGSDYLWEFKGGSQAGTGVDAKYNLYPIPATELSANPNLTQNSGY